MSARAEAPGRRPSGRHDRAAVLILVVLGLGLGLYNLAAKSIWLDEAISVEYVTQGVGTLWQTISGGDPNMPLYYVSLDVWVHMFGTTEAAVRSLSVLCGVLAIPVVVALGRRLFGEVEGLVAGGLLTLNAFLVQFDQTARAYAMVVLLVALAVYFFVLELECPTRLSAVGCVIANVLAVYTHYFAAYVLLVEVGTALALRRRAALNRRWLLMAGIVALALVPAVYAARTAGVSQISWLPAPTLRQLPGFLYDLNGRDTLLAALLGVFALYAAFLGLRAPAGRRWATGMLAAWFLVPVVLAFLTSFIQPVFVSYYLIVTLPAFVLLAATGIVRAPGRALTVAGLLGAVALSSLALANWYTSPSSEDFRAAARYMSDHRHPGDGYLGFPTYAAVPLDYYLARDGMLGLIDPVTLGTQGIEGNTPRIWLVVRERDAMRVPAQLAATERLIEKRYAKAGTPGFSGVRDVLFLACTAPASAAHSCRGHP